MNVEMERFDSVVPIRGTKLYQGLSARHLINLKGNKMTTIKLGVITAEHTFATEAFTAPGTDRALFKRVKKV